MGRRKKDPYRCPACGHHRKLTVPRVGPDKYTPIYYCVGGCWMKERA